MPLDKDDSSVNGVVKQLTSDLRSYAKQGPHIMNMIVAHSLVQFNSMSKTYTVKSLKGRCKEKITQVHS